MTQNPLETDPLHKVARSAVEATGSLLQSFTPVNQICQHISALHCYAHDITRQVRAEHYCTHHGNLHQCIIFDSDKPNARLIGIEYIVDEATFKSLPEDEKKYWHAHYYEIESGMLSVISKAGVPQTLIDAAERPVLQDLRRTYGKTFHTWQVDAHPSLPLGPPQLMMAFTKDGQVNEELLAERDAEFGISTADKRAQRERWLVPPPGQYTPLAGADDWQRTGESAQLEFVTRKTKMA